jgi:hypothetical protein
MIALSPAVSMPEVHVPQVEDNDAEWAEQHEANRHPDISSSADSVVSALDALDMHTSLLSS